MIVLVITIGAIIGLVILCYLTHFFLAEINNAFSVDESPPNKRSIFTCSKCNATLKHALASECDVCGHSQMTTARQRDASSVHAKPLKKANVHLCHKCYMPIRNKLSRSCPNCGEPVRRHNTSNTEAKEKVSSVRTPTQQAMCNYGRHEMLKFGVTSTSGLAVLSMPSSEHLRISIVGQHYFVKNSKRGYLGKSLYRESGVIPLLVSAVLWNKFHEVDTPSGIFLPLDGYLKAALSCNTIHDLAREITSTHEYVIRSGTDAVIEELSDEFLSCF